MYAEFRERAALYVVYIREAHPVDEWQVPSNLTDGVEYVQPRSVEERHTVATACAVGMQLDIPILIDGIDDAAERAFNAWPERLYVLARDGRVAYKGGKGPYNFDLDELHDFLLEYLRPSDRNL